MSYAAASDTSAVYFSGRGYHSTASSIAATKDGAGTVAAFNHGNTPSFSDLVDIINPLQHIPVIGTIYRQLTGDTESAMASIIGGTLYGGPIGAAGAMIDLGVHDETGKSTGDMIAGLFTDSKDTMTAATGAKAGATRTADAAAAPASTASKPLALAAGAAPAMAATAANAPAVRLTPTLTPTLAQASTTPTVLAQSTAPMAAQAAPAAMKAAPSKPMVVSMVSPQASSTNSANGGPIAEGNYLVFGSNDGDAASNDSGANAKSGQADLPQSATQVTAKPITVTMAPVAAPASAPQNAPKQFVVNGGNAAPAKSLPPLDDATAAMPAATTQISMQHPRIFPVPPRNGPASAPAVLPPPTTGPGALPGGKSQALSAQEMAVAQDPAHNFLSAYSQALDKYQAAKKLQSNPIQPAAAVTTSGPAGEDAEGDDTIPAPAETSVH